MNWTLMESTEQLSEVKQQKGYCIIFKHSTRCSISLMAKKRVELDKDRLPERLTVYYMDVIKYRELSNQIAQDFHVNHESPQLLLIKDGGCIFEQSHGDISIEKTLSQLS